MTTIPDSKKPTPIPEGFIHFQKYKEDIVYKFRTVHRDLRGVSEKVSQDAVRGEITSFSKRSKMRLMHQIRNSQHEFKQFVTLTYPKEFPSDGRVVKSHMNEFLTRLRQEFKGLQYVWVFEAQTRGAPHFHIILNVELPNERRADNKGGYFYSEQWSKCWSKITGNAECKKHLRRGLRIDPVRDSNSRALSYYMAKYYGKNEQKEFNSDFVGVGRYWGASRGFAVPLMQGLYRVSDIKWMLKLCFHYANLEREKIGLSKYAYQIDKGCSIWGFRDLFETKVEPEFDRQLAKLFNGLKKPEVVCLRHLAFKTMIGMI